MAGVFLSYDRDDTNAARVIATALEKAGHSVWWDLHVRGGAQFSKVIEEALKAAEVVVVLWSANSVESAWVRDEAAAGRDSGRLVPATIDGTQPPLGFRQFQTIDLSTTIGRRRGPGLNALLAAVGELARGPEVPLHEPNVTAAGVERRRRGILPAAALISIVLVLAIGGAAWTLINRSSPPTVAVVAGDTSAASQAFSRDLLVKLGSLQSANASALQLASPDSGREHSTLYFNVTAGADPGRQQASLALFDARRRLLLWSKDFESPSAKTADLKQQVAYTAAKVLACASEGLSSSASRLSFGTLKLYLSGCADYADVTGVSVGRLVPIFLKVTREAPGFRGGWAKLLLAESDFSRMDFLPEAAGILKPLPGHIVAARKLDAQMAEAFVAEAALLPEMAFGHRLSLLRRAVEVDPDNSPALEILSDNLLAVGRMSDAIERAQRAVAVDPLSPTARDTLVAALIHSGKLDAALAELRRAEQLWPGATSITNARFRIDLRYGDAREAMRLIESGKLSIGDQPYMESFLEARSDPTPTKVERAVVEARSSYERAPTVIYHLAQVLGTFHREEELFPILLNWPYPDRVSYVVDALFRPSLRNVRRDPRMIAVAKRLGLLEYWQHSGDWPDFCFEPDLPYDCKKEAAKLKV